MSNKKGKTMSNQDLLALYEETQRIVDSSNQLSYKKSEERQVLALNEQALTDIYKELAGDPCAKRKRLKIRGQSLIQ